MKLALTIFTYKLYLDVLIAFLFNLATGSEFTAAPVHQAMNRPEVPWKKFDQPDRLFRVDERLRDVFCRSTKINRLRFPELWSGNLPMEKKFRQFTKVKMTFRRNRFQCTVAHFVRIEWTFKMCFICILELNYVNKVFFQIRSSPNSLKIDWHKWTKDMMKFGQSILNLKQGITFLHIYSIKVTIYFKETIDRNRLLTSRPTAFQWPVCLICCESHPFTLQTLNLFIYVVASLEELCLNMVA